MNRETTEFLNIVKLNADRLLAEKVPTNTIDPENLGKWVKKHGATVPLGGSEDLILARMFAKHITNVSYDTFVQRIEFIARDLSVLYASRKHDRFILFKPKIVSDPYYFATVIFCKFCLDNGVRFDLITSEPDLYMTNDYNVQNVVVFVDVCITNGNGISDYALNRFHNRNVNVFVACPYISKDAISILRDIHQSESLTLSLPPSVIKFDTFGHIVNEELTNLRLKSETVDKFIDLCTMYQIQYSTLIYFDFTKSDFINSIFAKGELLNRSGVSKLITDVKYVPFYITFDWKN
jgi:hypothetical protein